MTPAITARAARRTGLSSRLDRLSEARFGLLMFLPAALLVGLFVLPPIIAVFGMSVFRIELLRPGPTMFVGLNNFTIRLPADSNFLLAIPRTIIFAAGTTIITVPLAIAAALIMNRRWRFGTLIGVALLLPWAIAPVVTGFFWRFMFQPTFGVMTNIANALGLANGTVPWLQGTETAMGIAMIATAWRIVPLLGLLLLAALKTIPDAHFRAARMDGAGAWQSFRFITLPALRPTLLITTVLTIIISLQTFDVIFQLTKGGPGFDTTTMTYYIFDSAINKLSLGYSAALALLLLVIIVFFSALVFLLRGRDRSTPHEEEDLTAASGRAFRRLTAISTSRVDSGPMAAALRRYEPEGFGGATGGRRWRMPGGLGRALFVAAAGALILWSVFPTLWILIASLQPEGAVTSRPLELTAQLDFEHFGSLLRDRGWQGSIFVSLAVSLGATALTLVIGALAAYPLARLAVPGRRVFLGLMVFTQMIPGIVLGIPVLLIFKNLGLKDSILGLILAYTAFLLPLIVWLLRNIFLSVPRSLEASARIDGATRIGTLFRITIPAAAAGIAAVAILLLISTWNEFLFAVILGDTGAVTVTRRIGFIDSPTSVSAQPAYTLQAAAGILAVLPCVILVFLFHRRISAGLTEGYVKG
jgi:multiple sugar transport system permease protein